MAGFRPINPKEDVHLLGEAVHLPSAAREGTYMETALEYWKGKEMNSGKMFI
jgi:hypothetical protein